MSVPRDELLFDAVLHPNRSLGRAGFWILMGIISAVCMTGGAIFLSLGAWPVTGFLGLDVVLVYGAFRLSYRSGRLTETVRLSRDALSVRRISPNGRVQAWDFQPYWLRVELEQTSTHTNRLTLSSHGRRLSVGAFLSAGERVELAGALAAALKHCRGAPAPAC